MNAVRTRGLVLATLVALSASACSDNTSPSGFSTDELTAELAIAPGHIHAYATMVTFTVAVTDPDGNPVTDFDVVQVESRVVGESEWEVAEATLSGDFYTEDQIFEEAGEYDVRVTGLRPSDSNLVVMYESATPVEVVRDHEDLAGYKVEFQPDPGHIHEGNTSTIQFWILDDMDDTPFTGLTPEIFVVEPISGETAMAATEGADGLYYADFTFDEVGDNEIGIRISAADALDGIGGEFSVTVEVHEPH